MPDQRLHLNCLVLLQSFETFWAYYFQSDGHLYANECRETAKALVVCLRDLAKDDSRVLDPVVLSLGEATDTLDIVNHLDRWANRESGLPYKDRFWSRWMVFGLLMGLKSFLLKELGVSVFPKIIISSQEEMHAERTVRWRGHLPSSLHLRIPDGLLDSISSTETIAVVGDIRRSQDLMTYAADAESFSRNMVCFIDHTRKLIDESHGIFDKFTGDGFIAYFNEAICDEVGQNFADCFVEFVRSERKFAGELFLEWGKTVRKLPATPVGLCIGADVGRVAFRDQDNHLIAVGDAIVWASRMSSVGEAGEFIINNLLFNKFEQRSDVAFEPRAGKTKAGEEFLARLMTFAS